MTSPNSDLLTQAELAVLRVVARMDLILGVAIGQTLGRPANDEVAALRMKGYVREISSPRHDGMPSHLYTITAAGSEALRVQDGHRAVAPGPTIGPRPPLDRETYAGSEMRPFTGRAGSMDALRYPSRVGNELRYRDDDSESRSKDAPPRKP